MSWMRRFFLGDIGAYLDYRDNRNEIRRLKSVQTRARGMTAAKDARIAGMRSELGRQKAVIKALTDLLVEKEIFTEDELEKRLASAKPETARRPLGPKLRTDRRTGNLSLNIPSGRPPKRIRLKDAS